jgi:hypothetical protein
VKNRAEIISNKPCGRPRGHAGLENCFVESYLGTEEMRSCSKCPVETSLLCDHHIHPASLKIDPGRARYCEHVKEF